VNTSSKTIKARSFNKLKSTNHGISIFNSAVR